MTDATHILSQIEAGDESAAEQLLPLIYEELRRLAAAKIAQENPGHTLQATALVHEAYLRLVRGSSQSWNGKKHFFGAAAEAMRRILVEAARRKRAVKHGGGLQKHVLGDFPSPDEMSDTDMLALNEALERLEGYSSEKAALVKLRFFAGLTIEEAAAALGISIATAKRRWLHARAWLYSQIAGSTDD